MKWEKIGTIGVDAGLCWVGDPCYVFGQDSSHGPKTWAEFCKKLEVKDADGPRPAHYEPLGDRIGHAVNTGYGDGEYAVYALIEGSRCWGLVVVFEGDNVAESLDALRDKINSDMGFDIDVTDDDGESDSDDD